MTPALTRPRVIAHRGASESQAEHTLGAYRQALVDGADGLECDVRLTADGHLVCVHDRRIERTSDGHGVLSTLELADLEALDWGSWKHPWADLDDEAPDVSERGVVTLDRLLQLVTEAARPVELAIETKHPTRYAGLVEERLVETLAAHSLAGGRRFDGVQARAMSFARTSLRRVRALAPSLPTVVLYTRLAPAGLVHRDGSLRGGAWMAGPSIELVRRHPDHVAALVARGFEVHVWTVNTAADARLCLRLGVQVLITDRPAMVRREVASHVSRAPQRAEQGGENAGRREGIVLEGTRWDDQ